MRTSSLIRVAALILVGWFITLSGSQARAGESSEVLQWKKHFGGKMGVALTSFRGDEYQQFDPRAGLTLGVFMRYGNYKLALQPEIQYAQRGAEDMGASYVEMSCFFKFLNPIADAMRALNDDGGQRMLYLGPTVGVKVGSDYESANATQFAVAFGADASWRLGQTVDVIFDARYSMALSKAYDRAGLQNEGLEISVGLLFE